MTPSGDRDAMGKHHSSEDLAAYLSGGLTPETRAVFERHIAECRTCRLEMVSARRLLRTSQPRTWRWAVPSALAAAAGIAFFSLTSSRPAVEEPTRDPDRASAGRPAELEVVSPSNGGGVMDSQAFTWRAHGADALYRFTISDTRGTTVWSIETRDTSVTLPLKASLAANVEYLWNVAAVDVSGSVRASTTLRFRKLP